MQWRSRCLVFSGRPRAAWELFTEAQASGQAAAAGEAGYALLLQLANDCYRVGAFYTAVKVCMCVGGGARVGEGSQARRTRSSTTNTRVAAVAGV